MRRMSWGRFGEVQGVKGAVRKYDFSHSRLIVMLSLVYRPRAMELWRYLLPERGHEGTSGLDMHTGGLKLTTLRSLPLCLELLGR